MSINRTKQVRSH